MIGSTLLLKRTRMILISVRFKTLLDGVSFTFIPCLRSVGTRHIISQMDVHQCQITRMENVLCLWGGGDYDGRKREKEDGLVREPGIHW